MRRRPLTTRKVLVASLGVASVTYTACSSQSYVGNFMSSSCETELDGGCAGSSSGSVALSEPEAGPDSGGAMDAAPTDATSTDAGNADATVDAAPSDAADATDAEPRDAAEGG